MTTESKFEVFGMLGEFDSGEELIAAAQKAKDAGYRNMEGFSPYPVHGLNEVLDFRDVRVGWIVFIFGLIGAISGISLIFYVSAVDYPLNVGGRPLFSWPSSIPVTFECTVLLASLSAFISVFALSGLPRPYHAVFDAKNFERASQDKFFLCVEATDPAYESEETRRFFESVQAKSISEVVDEKP